MGDVNTPELEPQDNIKISDAYKPTQDDLEKIRDLVHKNRELIKPTKGSPQYPDRLDYATELAIGIKLTKYIIDGDYDGFINTASENG